MPPHCDSLDGPVVKAAIRALAANDVDLALPFVKRDGEDEVRGAFQLALAARASGPDAREVAADLYFFETVARVHRGVTVAARLHLTPDDSACPRLAPSEGEQVGRQPERRVTVRTHEGSQRVDLVAHRVELDQGAQPGRHEHRRPDRVGGEEQRRDGPTPDTPTTGPAAASRRHVPSAVSSLNRVIDEMNAEQAS